MTEGAYRAIKHPHTEGAWVLARVDEEEKKVFVVINKLDHDSALDFAWMLNKAREDRGL